jgi:hypothetical protein
VLNRDTLLNETVDKQEMREPIKLVKILSNDPENFDKLHNSNKEDTVKLLEITTEKMRGIENKEDTVNLLEALIQRIKFLESKEQTIMGVEKNNCILANSCHAAKNKMGTCPCELCRT